MEIKELIQWLRDNSSGVYRPAREAADRLETMERTLRQMAECDLNESNCAGLDVASKRIRNLANAALR